MPTIRSAKESRHAHARKLFSPASREERYVQQKLVRLPMVPSSPSWKARTVVGRNFPSRVCTWCRMHCLLSRLVEHLDYRLRNARRVSPLHHSPKHVFRSKKSAVCNFWTIATTRIQIR